MKYCRNCGAELREGESFCTHCGQKVPASGKPEETLYAEAEYELEDEEALPESGRPSEEKAEPSLPAEPAPVRKKASGLSVAAFICSLTVILSGLGAIFAVVDLVKSRTQPRKRGLSIAALVICGTVVLLALIGRAVNLSGALKPQNEAPAATHAEQQASDEQRTEPASTRVPAGLDPNGFTVYVPSDEGNFAVILYDLSWNVESIDGGVSLVKADESERRLSRILVASFPVAELSPEQKNDPNLIIDDALSAISSGVDVSGRFELPVNGGYTATCADATAENGRLELAVWRTETLVYMVAVIEESFHSDTESVFYGLLNSFRLPSETAPHAAESPAEVKSDRMISLAAGDRFLVALRENGTVAVNVSKTSRYSDDFIDLSSWTDITAIDTDEYDNGTYVLGLKNDGTVLISIPARITGDHFGARMTAEAADALRQELKSWKDIISVEAGDYTVYGVTKSGNVVAACFNPENQDWLVAGNNEKAQQWKNIIQIKEVGLYLYGQKKDGSWVSTEEDVFSWENLKQEHEAIELGGSGNVEIMLLANGRIKMRYIDQQGEYFGTMMNTSDSSYTPYPFSDLASILSTWADMQKLLVFDRHIIGLRQDGTVLSVFNPKDEFGNNFAQCEVSGWEDVVYIAGNKYNTYGLKQDGTILHTGSDSWFDSANWR